MGSVLLIGCAVGCYIPSLRLYFAKRFNPSSQNYCWPDPFDGNPSISAGRYGLKHSVRLELIPGRLALHW
ncbi:hypothetical protein BJX66DRAFT_292586 [Aspergillus keveii]|uniref:Uncharacterized protein n=1 Tax=Aspergillus keveii TaxID=714993 RepID=A0ABR4GME8_9EURO